ncbi:hypothetical protein COO91_01373 [Nostoc flagelliforme CCNUN1]|uniref:Uncharacterized protein n=1 Tax=Nostoc flagelliforme CCNUN1 TaxID=2038116 RepID=A0A2K8SJM7_9NOSO|nr:hypothetical protein COO91_01373 [Nostoc flagelliforme CCNUN1]
MIILKSCARKNIISRRVFSAFSKLDNWFNGLTTYTFFCTQKLSPNIYPRDLLSVPIAIF